jgi:seryl-tRNA synthetase
MKLISQLSLVAIAALALTSCKKNAAADAATEMCSCSKPMVEILKKMDELKDKPEEMAKLAGDAQKVGAETNTCVKAIDEKYKAKQDDKKFEEEVKAEMEKKCPDVMKVLNGAGGQ